MNKHRRTIKPGSALSVQGRTCNPRPKGNWRQYAILAVALSAASLQGEVIVNNLTQPVLGWDGPIGTDANTNDFLLAQQIALPAANYASYVLNKVTLQLRPNGAAASVTVRIYDVTPFNNNPGNQIAIVASQLVPMDGARFVVLSGTNPVIDAGQESEVTPAPWLMATAPMVGVACTLNRKGL
jgi:hypothetical protein